MERRDNSSNEVATISHKETHTTIPTISKYISNEQYAYYMKDIKNDQEGTCTTTATPPSTTVTVQEPSSAATKKPKDFVNFSCFVILGCNFIFGFLGYYYGQNSNYAWQLGDINTAKKQAKKALIFNVIGIISGLLTYAAAIALFFTVFEGKVPEVKHSIG